MSQIGDFMVLSAPRGSFLMLLIIGLNDEFSNDASASGAGKPSPTGANVVGTWAAPNSDVIIRESG